MGEYEDRYPEAYGRGDPPPAAKPAGEEAPKPLAATPASDRPPLPGLVGLGAPTEPPLAWQHAPNQPARATEPVPLPNMSRTTGTYRGIGPRGYVRAPQRIYDDICDRLTDNPFIDASGIEVSVSGSEIILAGSVDSAVTRQQAEAIAQQVTGVDRVRNRLIVRAAQPHPAAADRITQARGAGPAR